MLLIVLLCVPPTMAWAQSDDRTHSPADSLATAEGDTLAGDNPQSRGLSGAGKEATDYQNQGQNQQGYEQDREENTSFFVSTKNNPKAGVRTNVTNNMYYGEFTNILNLIKSSTMTNKVGYSWTDFRQQIKTNEKRNASSSYNAGRTLPFMATLKGNYDWSEDNTTNAGGHENVSRRDFRSGGLLLSKPQLKLGGVNLTLKSAAGMNDQKSLTQGQNNNVAESYLDGGMQAGTEIFEGVTVAGRLYGRTTGGDRTLGGENAPSSSTTDSVGVGVYYGIGMVSRRDDDGVLPMREFGSRS